MQQLNPKRAPLKASEFTPKWLHDQRATVVRDKHTLRAGFPLCIEVKGPLGWHVLMLPSNGIEFETAEDRDNVLGCLTGTVELPPLPPPEDKP